MGRYFLGVVSSLVLRVVSLPGMGSCKGTLSQGECMFCFQADGERGQRVYPVPAFSQLPSAQNSPYARMAHFGVARSKLLQSTREAFIHGHHWLSLAPCQSSEVRLLPAFSRRYLPPHCHSSAQSSGPSTVAALCVPTRTC